MKAKSSGVYAIRNNVSGLVYIGSSQTVEERMRLHLLSLRRGNHFLPSLQSDWNELGEKSFSFMFLVNCDLKYARPIEKALIKAQRPNIYNRQFASDPTWVLYRKDL